MNDAAPILEARNLTKHFGRSAGFLRRSRLVHAVDGVSLSIRRGETFAIVGESGCGKSTLGRLLLRLLEPTSGQVFFRGEEITAISPDRLRSLRRELQVVFQDPFASLNPRMTVGQIIAEPIRLHRVAKGDAVGERVDELMRTVGLRPNYADRYPHEFSGGQRQRIGIARALASNPTLIVGDEPVSALDVSIQAQIVNLLDELKERLGLTMVIVAHDLAVVRHMSDRVAVMHLGQIVEMAGVDDLYETPKHPYTRALLSAIPVSHPAARRSRTVLHGDLPSPSSPPAGCRFHTRCPHARPLCSTTVPSLDEVAPGRQVACHLWRDLDLGDAAEVPRGASESALRTRLHLYRARQARNAAGV